MDRIDLLAAELFSYSYANYADHLGIGNQRFDKLMPDEAALLERAELEKWSDDRVAKDLEMDHERVPNWRIKFREAKAVVDAPNPAASFRVGVLTSIRYALEEGITSEEDIAKLVTQICYRASDLSVLLDLRGESLSTYSAALRREAEDI